MSELMRNAIITMAYEMAFDNALSRRQFYSYAQDLLQEVQELEAKLEELQTQPERKPLTDWQIKEIYRKNHWHEMDMFTWGAASVVVRAIEAAHGITGEQG